MDPALIAAGVAPTLTNTVEGRFIGRLVPGSNRFNGAFQAGQGINDQLQDGNAFKVSPRVGAVYDVTGRGATIVRGGWGIFFDRPQGNMVFDMISNAPGVLNNTIHWGRLQDLNATGGDPDPTLSLNPTAFDFEPPKVYQWNIGIQQKLPRHMVFDIAYIGSESKDILRQAQINAVPRGATFLPQNQDPTRAPSATPGATALPNDFLRPYPGYDNIRMWGYDGYSNYHALQTSVTRRFEAGYMFSVFYVWSKALTIANTDFTTGVPNVSDEVVRRLDYSYADYDRPHNFVVNFVYQVPDFASGTTGTLLNGWQLSGVYRWTSGRPYAINFSIPDIGAANLTGNDGNPGRAHRGHVRSGQGLQQRSVQPVQHGMLCPAAAGQRRGGVGEVLHGFPADQQPGHVVVEALQVLQRRGVRAAARRVQRAEPHAVHGCQQHCELHEPDRPDDHEPRLGEQQERLRHHQRSRAQPRTLQLVTRLTF